MKITQTHKDILAAIGIAAHAPISDIAKVTTLSDQSLRYHLHQLKQKKLIREVPFMNPYPLGYINYTFYFSLASGNQKTLENIIAYMQQSPVISWCGGVGGSYQFGVAVHCKNFQELVSFIDDVSKKFGAIFQKKSINMRVEYIQFPCRYLSDVEPLEKELSFGVRDFSYDISSAEQEILSYLANNPAQAIAQMARSLSMPLSTVRHRIRQLEKKKIIAGYFYHMNLAAFGIQAFQLLLFTKGLHDGLRDKLYTFAKSHKQIILFVRSIGEWDFELGVHVEQAEEVNTIVQELFEKFSEELMDVHVLPLFAYHKLSYYPK